MALRFVANTDARLLQAGTPYDSLGGLDDFDIAVRFYVTGSTGTTAANIVAKGADRFVLRRKGGTTYDLELIVRYTTAGAITYSLGTVTADAWHVVRFRHDGNNQYVYVDGSQVASDTQTGDSFLDDNTNFFQLGPSNTTNGLEVQVASFCGCSTKLTAGELLVVDDTTTDWDTLDLSSKTEWFKWDFLEQTTGNVQNTDTGLDNENTGAASLGDFQLWAGKGTPTWNANSPIVTPADLEILLDGQRFDTTTINLGTLRVGTAANGTDSWKCKGQIYNAGGTTFTVSDTTISGDITGTPTEPTGAVTAGSTLDFDFNVDTSSAGAFSVTVAITADESQSSTITFSGTVRAVETQAQRLITADDANYDGTVASGYNASEPTESATPHGSGFDAYRVAAVMDCGDRHFIVEDDFAVGVMADHADFGHIDYVEFFFENSTGTKIYTESPSPRHGHACYWAMLDVSSITETLGIIRVYARVVPVNGLERLLSVDLVLNTGGAANESVQTIGTGGDFTDVDVAMDDTTDQATKIQVLEFIEAGTYTTSTGTGNTTPGYVKVFRLGGSLVPGDVVLAGEDANRDGTPFTRPRSKHLIFQDISVDTEDFNVLLLNAHTGQTLAFHGDYDFTLGSGIDSVYPLYGWDSTQIGQQFFRNIAGEGQYIGLYGDWGWEHVLGPTGANILIQDITSTKDVVWRADGYYNDPADNYVLKCLVSESSTAILFQRKQDDNTLTVDSVTDLGAGVFKIAFTGTPTFTPSTLPDWRLRVITTTGNAQVGDEYTLISTGGEDTAYDTNGTTGYWVTTSDGYVAGDLVAGDTVSTGITYHADTWQTKDGAAVDNWIWWSGLVNGYNQQTMLLQAASITAMAIRNVVSTRSQTADELTQWQAASASNIVVRQMAYAGPEQWTTAGSWGGTAADFNMIQNSILQQAQTDLGDDQRIAAFINCHFDAGTARGTDSTGSEEISYDANYRPTGFTADLRRAYNVRAFYDRLGNIRPTSGEALLGATVDAAPTITNVSPATATLNTTGQTITLTGTGFIDGATTTITAAGKTAHTVNSTTVNAADDTDLNVDFDGEAGTYTITLTNPDGQTATATVRVLTEQTYDGTVDYKRAGAWYPLKLRNGGTFRFRS